VVARTVEHLFIRANPKNSSMLRVLIPENIWQKAFSEKALRENEGLFLEELI
jgi:hypothetical protein